jgi:hypothetical protein
MHHFSTPSKKFYGINTETPAAHFANLTSLDSGQQVKPFDLMLLLQV